MKMSDFAMKMKMMDYIKVDGKWECHCGWQNRPQNGQIIKSLFHYFNAKLIIFIAKFVHNK